MGIETRLVYGFPGAGKTYYISDCIANDYFHKYGSTLILCFERGELDYDISALSEKRTSVVYYDGKSDIKSFCTDAIATHNPGRIYVEMDSENASLKDSFPHEMNITYQCTFFNWPNLRAQLANNKQAIGQMVAASSQITFRACPSKALLAPYSQTFRLMNARATYLRQDPMGYHEKAFDLFLPFSLDSPTLRVTRDIILPLWLDSLDHPEHYNSKKLCFTDALEIRKVDNSYRAGLVVMTCCMSDLQFLSFPIQASETLQTGWFTFTALASVSSDNYGNPILALKPEELTPAKPPKDLIFNPNAEKTPSMRNEHFRGLPRI